MILFHFTCLDHGAPGIDASGLIRPPAGPRPAGLPPVVWLTDDPDIDPAALGIDPARAVVLTCDRTAVRYAVDCPVPIRWLGSSFRRKADPEWVTAIEDRTCGADPARWFVSRHPMRPFARVEVVRP